VVSFLLGCSSQSPRIEAAGPRQVDSAAQKQMAFEPGFEASAGTVAPTQVASAPRKHIVFEPKVIVGAGMGGIIEKVAPGFSFPRCSNPDACEATVLLALRSALVRVLSGPKFNASPPTNHVGLRNESCFERSTSQSLIQGTPYFEDVRYCATWQRNEKLIYLRLEAWIAVTKNPGSPYREPNEAEMSTYQAEITKAYSATLKDSCAAVSGTIKHLAARDFGAQTDEVCELP
jgi:hypothetical protein